MASIIPALRDPPAPKAEFDFLLNITARRGIGDSTRAFAAADALITAFQAFGLAVAPESGLRLKTVAVFEEVQAGQVRSWLRFDCEAGDRASQRESDPPTPFLIAAVVRALRWIRNAEEGAGLAGLHADLQRIATESLPHDPEFRPSISAGRLARAVEELVAARRHLLPFDRAEIVLGGERLMFEPAHWLIASPDGAIAVSQEYSTGPVDMLLQVERPDYQGGRTWRFRHGEDVFDAWISDTAFLDRFLGRTIDVRPGDTLHALVDIACRYGPDHVLIDKCYRLVTVKSLRNAEPVMAARD